MCKFKPHQQQQNYKINGGRHTHTFLKYTIDAMAYIAENFTKISIFAENYHRQLDTIAPLSTILSSSFIRCQSFDG